jgi:hypothetical protein
MDQFSGDLVAEGPVDTCIAIHKMLVKEGVVSLQQVEVSSSIVMRPRSARDNE